MTERLPGTALRILATNDLGGAFLPVRTSWGEAGTCAGVAARLARELEGGPALWLDSGDLTVGAAHPLVGARRWDDIAALPIAAAAPGNHDFDGGLPELPFPLLCANADAGLAPATLLDTDAGPLGVIGITHPAVHEIATAPAPVDFWEQLVGPLADGLRERGARWVVALLHDGAAWWPQDGGIDTRPDHLARVTRAWAGSVDLVLGGHTLGAWSGTLGATPAGHAFPFGSSVLVVDLPEPPERPVVRGCERVDGVRPARDGAATEALAAAAGQVVGESRNTWLTRTGAEHYLPELVAAALCDAAGADAGLVPAFQHASQAPLDGAVAALGAGPVTELDLLRLFDYADDHTLVVELEPGELTAAARVHDATCDPRMRAADDVWWAWCRMPAAVSRRVEHPRTVAVIHGIVPLLAEWLGRELRFEPGPLGGRAALARALA